MAEVDLSLLPDCHHRHEMFCFISQIYETGITPNAEKAMQFLTWSADNQAYPKAQYLLGKKYAEKKKMEEAEKWFRRSAESGYNDAQYEMTLYDDRIKWLTLLADKGDFRGIYELATNDWNSGQVNETRLKYLNLYLEKFPDQNYGLIHQYLGEHYLHGISTEINYERAYHHLTNALALVNQNKYCRPEDFGEKTDRDDTLSDLFQMLGDIYFHGYGTDQVYETARIYYQEAIRLTNDGHSLFQSHQIYKDGLGVEVDMDKANDYLKQSADADDENGQYHRALQLIKTPILHRYWYTKDCNEIETAEAESLIKQIISNLEFAAEEDHIDACIRLAWMYWGINYEKSYDWLLQAKGLDYERADVNFYLGIIYKNGFFAPKDYEKAIECFEFFLSKYEGEELLIKYTVSAYKDVLKTFDYDLDEVNKDHTKAFHCCQTLVKYDNIKAQFILSWLLWEGLGVERNQNEAFKMYVMAVNNDKNNELSYLKEKLKNFETQMLMTKMKQFEDENKEVINMREELQKTKNEYEQLKEQLNSLKKMVEVMKEKQDSNGIMLKN